MVGMSGRHSGAVAAVDALAQVETNQGYRSDFHDNVMEVEQGNSAAYAMRRLAAQAPALHAQVLAGELSPHAAAIEAGIVDGEGLGIKMRARYNGGRQKKRTFRNWLVTGRNVLLHSYVLFLCAVYLTLVYVVKYAQDSTYPLHGERCPPGPAIEAVIGVGVLFWGMAHDANQVCSDSVDDDDTGASWR